MSVRVWSINGVTPVVDPTAFVHPSAVLIGDVLIGAGCYIGPSACLRFVDHRGAVTERYPYNPNGSPRGITGLTTADGRFTILMPHPERVFRTAQMSWHPEEWGEDSPWMRMFRNARGWLG